VLVSEEGSGILNWAIEGAKLLAERGEFTINEQSRIDMHHNTKESNSVYSFMDDVFDFDDKYTKEYTKKDLYHAYKDYCLETRVGMKAYNTFCTEIKRFANETKLIKEDRSYNNYYYVGLTQK
jgi:hypothetical protein